MGTSPCTVDFRITVPFGSTMLRACRRPAGVPVASTTSAGHSIASRKVIPGNFGFHSCAAAMRS